MTVFFSITVVKETCSCLKALLSTQIGLSLLKKYNDNTPFDSSILEPFKQKKKVNVSNCQFQHVYMYMS